jgi:hypothetical protein
VCGRDGDEVLIDKKSQGRSPASVRASTGGHLFECVSSNGAVLSRRITIESGGAQTFTISSLRDQVSNSESEKDKRRSPARQEPGLAAQRDRIGHLSRGSDSAMRPSLASEIAMLRDHDTEPDPPTNVHSDIPSVAHIQIADTPATTNLPARARSSEPMTVTRARELLEDSRTQRAILMIAHLGLEYLRVEFSGFTISSDGSFVITYNYYWQIVSEGIDPGIQQTVLAFAFSDHGILLRCLVVRDSFPMSAFYTSSVVVERLGTLARRDPDLSKLPELKRAIDNADMEKLMILFLRLHKLSLFIDSTTNELAARPG